MSMSKITGSRKTMQPPSSRKNAAERAQRDGAFRNYLPAPEPNLAMRKAALFSLGLSLFLLGCLHAPDPQATAPMPGQPMAYTLKPADILDIEITGDADMSRQYPIDVDGTIALPLIGSIPAAGSSV